MLEGATAGPQRVVLEGRWATLRPLDAGRDGDALYRALHDPDGDPHLWDYLWQGPFDRPSWDGWMRVAEASTDPLFFSVLAKERGDPLGYLGLMDAVPRDRRVEVGSITFGSALQRTALATEAVYLLARYAFDDLGYRRLEWKCNAANERSRRAAERYGFRFEGVFRQHMIVKGRNRDTAWYSMLDGEWPAHRAAIEAWLAPENFDAGGAQRRRLEELRPG